MKDHILLYVLLKGTISSRSGHGISMTEKNNTPHYKVILPLLLHKWASNFRSLCSSSTRAPIPCPVESLLWSWRYCPFKGNVYMSLFSFGRDNYACASIKQKPVKSIRNVWESILNLFNYWEHLQQLICFFSERRSLQTECFLHD